MRINYLKSEIFLCVVVGDVTDHPGDGVHLGCGDLSGLDIGANHIAEDAAEIFMARVADEAAGVGQHAYEAAQKAKG